MKLFSGRNWLYYIILGLIAIGIIRVVRSPFVLFFIFIVAIAVWLIYKIPWLRWFNVLREMGAKVVKSTGKKNRKTPRKTEEGKFTVILGTKEPD
jgi:hypothetical protein